MECWIETDLLFGGVHGSSLLLLSHLIVHLQLLLLRLGRFKKVNKIFVKYQQNIPKK